MRSCGSSPRADPTATFQTRSSHSPATTERSPSSSSIPSRISSSPLLLRISHERTSRTSDGTAKIWDLGTQEELNTFNCKALPQDLHWNYNGSLICVSSKDKMDRIFDARQGTVVSEWQPHEGTKCSKMAWLGDCTHIVTTGFNRTSQREWKLWDLKNLAKPIAHDSLDMVVSVAFREA